MKLNMMSGAQIAHNEASREGHARTFGEKCEWHGCRDAVAKKAGRWLCSACYEEYEANKGK